MEKLYFATMIIVSTLKLLTKLTNKHCPSTKNHFQTKNMIIKAIIPFSNQTKTNPKTK